MTDLVSSPPSNAPKTGYDLLDRYRKETGRVFMSGVQALARLPLEQLRADRRAGRNTAAFVSGYPGSPLAGYGGEVANVVPIAALEGLRIVNQPAVNEELAATAVMGSQLSSGIAGSRYDGVVGLWYGKAPGLDRASDALRHAVFAGTSHMGGAVALVGDDPLAKSSTLPSSSDATLVDLHMPILYPGDGQEVLDLGLHAIALSRATGLWTALKIVAAVADGTGTVDLDPTRVRPRPELDVDGQPYVFHPSGKLITPFTVEVEREFRDVRLELARRYGVTNGLNRVTINPPDAWLGIVASGHTYHETIEALRLLGLDDEHAIAGAGIRLVQLRLPVPLDRDFVRSFAKGLSEVFVVEEKNPTLEWLVKDALYGGPDQPKVTGKTDPSGAKLLQSHGALDADVIIGPLRSRLLQKLSPERLAPLPTKRPFPLALTAKRAPFFCSGCPHNWGTKVPEGALVGGGIGCHGMISLMDEDRVGEIAGISAMGTEGATWVGMAPFVARPHLIQNLGDGTFFHSGHLAVRFAVASGVNITYKLLYNSAVAMTGGQHPEGAIPVPQVAQMMLLEGVKQVLITTEDPGKYREVTLPRGVEVWDRTRIVEAQERLAKVAGVTMLIHDQECAAELRRSRKRGKRATPTQRIFINERVCEGCGDCGRVSNCLSVQPVDTPFGRKTRIDQTSCNLDYSCIKGDCPSFATVKPRKAHAVKKAAPPDRFPRPTRIVPEHGCTIRMPGIGGTGVVTVSQILGTAAMLEGKAARGLDQTGLSQKAGPVVSDVRIEAPVSADGDESLGLQSNKATEGGVDCLIALDLLAATSEANLCAISPERTVVIGSTAVTPTGSMVSHPDHAYPAEAELRGRLDRRSRAQLNRYVNAAAVTTALFGEALTANVFMVGVALQAGAIPLDGASIESAITLNGVSVERNTAAFRWGRQWFLDPTSLPIPASSSAPSDGLTDSAALPTSVRSALDSLVARTGLGEILTRRVTDLIGYQSGALAVSYLADVTAVADAEAMAAPGSWALTKTVAEQLHKLMAYKDEYEVARLLTAPEAKAEAERAFGPGAKVVWQLHPPILRSMGMKNKLKLGPWARPLLRLLASGKRLRGTPVDVFGWAKLRRTERAMIAEYREAIQALSRSLTSANVDEAVAIAGLPDEVRGYESLKTKRAADYRVQLDRRVAAFTRLP